MRHAIQLDFAGRRRGISLVGGLLLAAGAMAASGVLLEYRVMSEHRAGLETRLATLARAKARVPPVSSTDVRVAASAEQAALDLATPWTLLLSELERASKEAEGQVAVLGVEPDHAKHNVRVIAESRTLALALSYIERLQSSRSLQYPMLDRHEIRADDPQHPVRFELTGAWRDAP